MHTVIPADRQAGREPRKNTLHVREITQDLTVGQGEGVVTMEKLLLEANKGQGTAVARCTTEQMLVRSDSMDIVIKRLAIHFNDKQKPEEQFPSGSNLS